jgi:hypothetical protein
MILQEIIKIPVINSGVNDDTTAYGLARIQKDVIDHNLAIVLINFCGNDLYNSKPKLKINETRNNFREMIELLDNGNCMRFAAIRLLRCSVRLGRLRLPCFARHGFCRRIAAAKPSSGLAKCHRIEGSKIDRTLCDIIFK